MITRVEIMKSSGQYFPSHWVFPLVFGVNNTNGMWGGFQHYDTCQPYTRRVGKPLLGVGALMLRVFVALRHLISLGRRVRAIKRDDPAEHYFKRISVAEPVSFSSPSSTLLGRWRIQSDTRDLSLLNTFGAGKVSFVFLSQLAPR